MGHTVRGLLPGVWRRRTLYIAREASSSDQGKDWEPFYSTQCFLSIMEKWRS